MESTPIVIAQRRLKNQHSGTPRKVFQEIQALTERGYAVHAVAEKINRNAVREVGGIPHKALRWPIKSIARCRFFDWQAQRHIRRIQPKLVIGHGDITQQDVLVLHNCLHLAQERINPEARGSETPSMRFHEQLLRAGHYRLIVCNSRLMQSDLKTRYGLSEDRLPVIYPEYDDEQFRRDNRVALRATFRSQYGISDDMPVVGLITSGDFRKRNVGLVIDALAEFIRTDRCRLLLVGQPRCRLSRERLAAQGIEDKVILAPTIDQAEIYYHGTDLFVLPALLEEFGRSALEAMACGLPVVLSRHVGATEILPEISRSFVLDDISELELRTRVDQLLRDPALRAEIGAANHKAAQQYTAAHQTKRFMDLIEPLLK